MQMTRAIVTGGSGFIGSHLVDALVEQGVDVNVIDFAEPKYRSAKATYINHDIRHEGLNEIFANLKPDVVFHLAAQTDNQLSIKDPVTNAEHNELGLLRVLEAARRAQTKKVVLASTCAVYGAACKLAVTEKVTPQPLSPYAVSKLTGEYYLRFYEQRYGLAFVALRIANVYGPRQDGSKEGGAVAIFTSKLLAQQAPFMNDDGATVLDYIYVSDVTAALLAAAESQVSGVFNCGTKVGTSTSQLYALIANQVGADLKPMPRPEVKDPIKLVSLRSAAARKHLGWKATTRLKRGLKQTIKWYKQRT